MSNPKPDSAMKTFLHSLSAAAFLTAALVSASASAALLTSDPLAQDGIQQSFKPPQQGEIGTFNFTDPADALASITGLQITLTITDGDTGSGNFDYGQLTLALDDIDTGLLLNGFTDGQTITQTLSLANLGSTLAQALYAQLMDDGELEATILDTDNDTVAGSRDHTNGKNFVTLTSGHNAALTLIGTAPAITPLSPNTTVPEPATLALAGLGLAGLGLSRRRRPV